MFYELTDSELHDEIEDMVAVDEPTGRDYLNLVQLSIEVSRRVRVYRRQRPFDFLMGIIFGGVIGAGLGIIIFDMVRYG